MSLTYAIILISIIQFTRSWPAALGDIGARLAKMPEDPETALSLEWPGL
uniref:Uncharacterized protein n=1 Tax=Anguilla anguilla TaxID=7936 RepID=A0A0E9SAF4_ANGAN